ncbi:unnamed protein product, partial [Prunus brigantina]
ENFLECYCLLVKQRFIKPQICFLLYRHTNSHLFPFRTIFEDLLSLEQCLNSQKV